MSYINIFCDKKNDVTHLWADDGYKSFSTIRYAYRKKIGGKYKSLFGDELEKITDYDDRDPSLFEGDLNPAAKCLLDLYPGDDEVSKSKNIIIIDIEVDIEGGYPKVELADKMITAIALYDYAGDKYYSFILDKDGLIDPSEIGNYVTISFRNEERLLEAFLDKWEELRPIIVSGWNSSSSAPLSRPFDIPYLYTRIRNVLGKSAIYQLSPIGIVYQNKFNKQIIIAGVSCLDYMDLYKKFVGEMKPSYSLANVAKAEELSVQKLTYKGSLNDLYKTDLKGYVEYNLVDVKVIVELDKKYDFIHLARSVCHKGHVPYEWFQMSSRWIDGAILDYLHSKNLIAPNKPEGGREEYEQMEEDDEEGFEGAYVKDPTPGLYDWICSADITSLYPSLIRTLGISPETKVGKISNWDKSKFDSGELDIIKVGDVDSYSNDDFKKMISDNKLSIAANGTIYRQDIVGTIPHILDLWFEERVKYRKMASNYGKEGNKELESFYDRRQKRQKIFLNSCYGVLGLPVFRFYDKDNAEAVTLSGQMVIRNGEKIVNNYFNSELFTQDVDSVVYIDTDSLYFSLESLINKNNIQLEGKVDFCINTLKSICEKINTSYETFVPAMFNVSPDKNVIKIVPDVITEKTLFLRKKRYAMLKVYDMEKLKIVKDKHGNLGKLEVKGIDVVRSSFPSAFRKILGEELEQILRGTPKEILNEKLMVFNETINEYPILALAKGTSVKFISKSGLNDYNPKGRELLQFVKGSQAQVKAALAYNDLLKVWKLDKIIEPIFHGEKIKWIYLFPNEYNISQIAIKELDHPKMMEFAATYIDRDKMLTHELHGKLTEIYSAIGWEFPSRGSELSKKLFDFNEEW